MPTLHVHLDESGCLRFKPKGTRYYIFTVAWTYDPAPLANELTKLRFSLLREGANLQSFHASEDQQRHRDRVVATMVRDTSWLFAAAVVEKSKVYPVLREPHRFYPRFASSALRFVFRGRVLPRTERVLVFTDSLPIRAEREAAEKAIKETCRIECGRAVSFGVFHHRRESNPWLQVADYCSWATFRKWEFGDARTYDLLKARLAAPEKDILAAGISHHYSIVSRAPLRSDE